ncbi:MAG: MFS transporter [Chloroflexales bacterium]|nr:MFS transporter [Chloroflexales bacterium]
MTPSESRPPQPPAALAPQLRSARPSIRQTFAALKYRNYRLWFIGQLVSLFGSWMQMTAQGYLVFQLTGSPAYLGYVGFAAGVPVLLFTLYGGVVADRIARRTLLLFTQTAMMLLAFVLAALVFAQVVQPWHIIALAFGLGVANAFDGPARLAFVRELVDREDMTNAIALNATMFNTATATGPAIAGLTYAFIGPAWCFMLNGLSFLAVLAALLLMRIAPHEHAPRRGSAWAEVGVGLRYIAGAPAIYSLLFIVGITSMFGISSATLFPAWAVQILGGDATTNGLLQSARGFGALLGALLLASLGHFPYKGRLLTVGTFAFPTMLLIFTFIRWLPLALLVLVGTGLAVILVMNVANALVQNLVPDALRGRVMSVYSMTFFGSMPLGALWIGAVAERISSPAALMVGAFVSLGCAVLIFVFAPRVRRLQ